MEKLLVTVCGRAGSKGFKNKNLKTFCGRPLVYYSLSAAHLFAESRPDVQVDICLNTDSEDLAKLVAEKYPEVIYLHREGELAGDRAPKMAVIQDSLHRMEEKQGYSYDYVMDLDITSPLRTAQDVTNAYNMKAERQDLDLVFSVTEARRNPYFNQVRDCGDHIEKGIENKPGEAAFTARQMAPVFYDVNASIYVYKRDFLANNTTGIIWDAKIHVVEMMDTGVLDIDSEEDFKLMEVIGGHLYSTMPAFAQVRDHIRE